MKRLVVRRIVSTGESINIEKILRVYQMIDRGKIDFIQPTMVDDALLEMHEYYDDYIKWYGKYGIEDPGRQGEASGERTEEDIYADFVDRLSEIKVALHSDDVRQKLTALDLAVNQVHIDYPVIAHLTQMNEYEEEIGLERFSEIGEKLITTLDRVRQKGLVGSIGKIVAQMPIMGFIGLDLGDAQLVAQNGHLVSKSKTFLLDDEEILKYLKHELGYTDKDLIVPWGVREGVNLYTSPDDIKDAPVIAAVEVKGQYMEFGPYIVAQDPAKTRLKYLLYKNIELSPEGFLQQMKGIKESAMEQNDEEIQQEEEPVTYPQLINFIQAMGFQEDIIMGVDEEETEDKLVNKVRINISRFEEVPFLKGGKILSVLQAFAKRLPAEQDGRKIEWIFVPNEEIEEQEPETETSSDAVTITVSTDKTAAEPVNEAQDSQGNIFKIGEPVKVPDGRVGTVGTIRKGKIQYEDVYWVTVDFPDTKDYYLGFAKDVTIAKEEDIPKPKPEEKKLEKIPKDLKNVWSLYKRKRWIDEPKGRIVVPTPEQIEQYARGSIKLGVSKKELIDKLIRIRNKLTNDADKLQVTNLIEDIKKDKITNIENKTQKKASIKFAGPGPGEARLLNSAFGKLGEEAMKSGLLDVAVAYQIGKHIINKFVKDEKPRKPYFGTKGEETKE